MVFSSNNLENVLSQINFQEVLLDCEILPSKLEGCNDKSYWTYIDRFDTVSKLENLPENSDIWGFFLARHYESAVDLIIKGINNVSENNYVGNPVFLALENAFLHGNKNNPDESAHITLFYGDKGSLVSIEDSGSGFDYERKVNEFHEAKSKYPHLFVEDNKKEFLQERINIEPKYFTRRGYGFTSFDMTPAEVFFSEGGKITNILFPYSSKTSSILRKDSSL